MTPLKWVFLIHSYPPHISNSHCTLKQHFGIPSHCYNRTFRTAEWTIDGYESIYMMRKGQTKNVGKKDIRVQIKFIEDLFGIAA